jgi:DnaJ-class molecular chaperone
MTTTGRGKLRHPVGKCTNCGDEVYDLRMTNERCTSGSGKRRCRGVIRSMVSVGDWKECETCGATGFVGSETCASCDGTGWFHARKN